MSKAFSEALESAFLTAEDLGDGVAQYGVVSAAMVAQQKDGHDVVRPDGRPDMRLRLVLSNKKGYTCNYTDMRVIRDAGFDDETVIGHKLTFAVRPYKGSDGKMKQGVAVTKVK